MFNTCKGLIDDIMAIQHDEKNPSDCAKQPHDLTHRPDALRYYCATWTMKPKEPQNEEDYVDNTTSSVAYSDFICGDGYSEDYVNYF